MCAGMPYYTDAWSRSAAGRITPLGRPTSAFRCLIAMNYKKEGALSIYLAVDLDVVAWSSTSGATGGGRGVGLLCRQGVRQSLYYLRSKHYDVCPGGRRR